VRGVYPCVLRKYPTLLALFLAAANGQVLEFEAASVKPSGPNDLRGATFQFTAGGGITVTNGDLKGLIEMAYEVRDFQISGGPGWVNSERYGITANAPRDGADSIKNARLRLQTLLAQRFQLQIHHETRTLPEYALVVSKSGSKLERADASAKPMGIRTGCGEMTGTGATMSNLVMMLSRQLGRPVLEQTGLADTYNFQLHWTPDLGPCSGQVSDVATGSSLFTALQEQLGLRLLSIKGPVEIIVIDHTEKADDN
jgi:bla regulator protein blaR1